MRMTNAKLLEAIQEYEKWNQIKIDAEKKEKALRENIISAMKAKAQTKKILMCT